MSKRETVEKDLSQLTADSTREQYKQRLITTAWERDLSAAEMRALYDRFPFITLSHGTEPLAFSASSKPKRSLLEKTGWVLLDWGNQFIAGPGELLFGKQTKEADSDDEGEGGGTTRQGGIDTVYALFQQLLERNWGNLFVDGTWTLQRLAWMLGCETGLSVHGFEPTDYDRDWHSRMAYVMRDKQPVSGLMTASRAGHQQR